MNKAPVIHFSFIPFPLEIWDENVDLSLAEFRLLGYLLKQVRFGQAVEPVSDDELINGRIINGKRIDRGCGLSSRNGIKQAREALVIRGWVEAKNTSDDPTRPRWMYSVRFQTGVTERHEVSRRDTMLSRDDSTVSQDDTCNKVIEKPIEEPKEEPNTGLFTKPINLFEKAYQQYPRHVGRPAAEKAWAKIGSRLNKLAALENSPLKGIGDKSEDFIYQRVMQYAAVCQRTHKDKQFIPHMATWLNQDRFMDDPTEWAVETNGQTTKAERRVANVAEKTDRVFGTSRGISEGTPKRLPDRFT